MIPKYITRKLIFYFFSFWFILFIDFLIPHLMPGNPANAIIGQLSQEVILTPQQINQIESSIGFSHDPIYIQFFKFVLNIFQGNFGISYQYFPTPVLTVISESIWWTILLFGTALIISFYLGNFLGLRAAYNRGKTKDSILSVITLFFYSFPYFWLALIFLYFFAIVNHIFPEAGAVNPNYTVVNLVYVISAIKHMVLPLITLVISSYAAWYLGMRNNTISVLNEDYIKYAEIAGLSKEKIYQYSRKNAILPNLTALAISLGNIISGGILVEMVFSYPGLGYDIYNAVVNEDFPVLEASFFLVIISVLVANLVMDLLYYRLDPRIREE
ncbi:MAG: ABC transporter permease [Thermoplasmata archaeon]